MQMSSKRHRKIQGALKDLPAPEILAPEGDLDVGVISWGSTVGSVLEAVTRAHEKGLKVGAMKIASIFPFHAETIRAFMSRSKEVLIPELNFGGQLADLIGHLHRKDVVRMNRATGVPIAPSVILEEIEAIVEANAK